MKCCVIRRVHLNESYTSYAKVVRARLEGEGMQTNFVALDCGNANYANVQNCYKFFQTKKAAREFARRVFGEKITEGHNLIICDPDVAKKFLTSDL